MDSKPTCVALIPPAPAPSAFRTRTSAPGRPPLIAYSISAALQSGVFAAVVVSTDSQRYAEVSAITAPKYRSCGRSNIPATPPRHRMGGIYAQASGRRRPPLRRFQHPAPHQSFRLAETIQRPGPSSARKPGWIPCGPSKNAASIRRRCGGARSPHAAAAADRPCRPALAQQPIPLAAEVYVQNASLEMAWSRWCSRIGPLPATY